MKINIESYPEDVNAIFSKAFTMASKVLAHLNHQECPQLRELFVEHHKTCGVQPEFSIRRNKQAFENLGYKSNITSGKSKSLNEFKGLYFLGEKNGDRVLPVYVGISRTVYRRLRQHGFGKRHNECSLAYLMASSENEKLNRSNVHIDFDQELAGKREVVKNLYVALQHVPNDYDLYLLEVSLAGILKTKWNSFRTH